MLAQISKLNFSKGLPNPVKPNVLLLTSSLLIDRMMLYSDFLETLKDRSRVKIWSTSYTNERYREMWLKQSEIKVEKFPEVEEFPKAINYLRRLNEFTWDARQKLPSRESMERHRRQNRGAVEKRILRPLAEISAYFKLEQILENRLESLLINRNRSQEALEILQTEKPDVILVTAPFQFRQPAIAAIAKALRIPVLCLIPSWDNISTKNRPVFKYDGYLVWSEELKRQLREFYPEARNVPIYVTGAAQFDVFFQSEFFESRQEFCAKQNLNPQLPVIVYALGSPNFLREYHGAVHLAERIVSGDLGNVQMLVRPHPVFDNGKLGDIFQRFAPFVRVQKINSANEKSSVRSQDTAEIKEWINTFRHADVVVNLSSTVTIDAALFDCPVVNLDFDPQPGKADQELIKEINHVWTHFKPIAESGGVWLVNDFEELVQAVKTYLEKPDLHQEKRRWIAEYVCGFTDGKCGKRMAEAVLNFAANSGQNRINV